MYIGRNIRIRLAIGYTAYDMTDTQTARRYRFGSFEVDTATGELRRQGIRIKLNAQPLQVLALLLERPGELLTREEISRELWPDGTFVDYEHGVNSAVNRIREALGDTAGNPRFVETLARRGYRFVAPVERILPADPPPTASETSPKPAPETPAAATPSNPDPEAAPFSSFLASPHELPRTSYPVVQTLFVLLQLMYVAFYVGALANLPEIEDLLSPLTRATEIYLIMIVTAAVLIIVRTFVRQHDALQGAPRAGHVPPHVAVPHALRRFPGRSRLPSAAPHQLQGWPSLAPRCWSIRPSPSAPSF